MLKNIKLFGYKLTLGKIYNRKTYMKMYNRKNSDSLNAYQRRRYNQDINGIRTRKLEYEKRKRHPMV